LVQEAPAIDFAALHRFALDMLGIAGLPRERSEAVATVLLETEAMGYPTHGLALLPRYLDAISSGRMGLRTEIIVATDTGPCLTLNAQSAPGQWVMLEAVSVAIKRAQTYGLCALAIRESFHIGALAPYLRRVANAGHVALLFTSAPGIATVAPAGSVAPVLSPAPTGFAYPRPNGAPILIDVSASMTTNNAVKAARSRNERLPEASILDNTGGASDDPAALSTGGAILPVGGLTMGHKGTAWALMAELLSQGLSGHDRNCARPGMENALLLQVLSPAAFAGVEAAENAASAIASRFDAASVSGSVRSVRLPGTRALAALRHAEEQGLSLDHRTIETLSRLAAQFAVQFPDAHP